MVSAVAIHIALINRVFVQGAGASAEARLKRKSLRETWLGGCADDDMSHGLAHLEPFILDETVRRKTIIRIWDKGKRLIWAKNAWSAIKDVADALLAGWRTARL